MPLFYKSLTGSNIFIEPKTKQLKIVVPSIMMKKAGPNQFMAIPDCNPHDEKYVNIEGGIKQDIYGFGMILLELISKNFHYEE
jgi:hypothetical protein